VFPTDEYGAGKAEAPPPDEPPPAPPPGKPSLKIVK
jgi:hypothetical protein